jgi:SWI/SNF-related matrix-associated actin-dependent regulator 1 of chromatin subfamily A
MITAQRTTQTRYGPKVVLDSDYEDKEKIKSLPWEQTHRSWTGSHWTVDYRPEIVDMLDEIGAENLDWLRDEFEEQLEEASHYQELSQAEDADFDVPAPEGLDYYPFQKAGIQYATEKFEDGEDGVLIADEMGLGKTIQALGVINALDLETVVVVCPASLKQNWAREARTWLTGDLDVNVYQEGAMSADVEIVNYALLSTRGEKLPEIINEHGPELLVLDESHFIKNRKAKRTKAAKKIKAERRLFLTGTPIKNRPIELWQQVSELTDEFDFWPYAKTYCGAKKTRWGWDMDGATNLGELQERLRSSVMVRRQKEDVLTDLPEKMRQVIPLAQNGMGELVQEEQEAYKKHEDQIADAKRRKAQAEVNDDEEAYQKAVEDLKEARKVAFERIAEIRKKIAVEKAGHVIQHVNSVLESEDKVVVFAHHKAVIEKLQDEFGDQAVSLTGDTPQKERQEVVDQFQDDPDTEVFIGSIHAAGTGITLTAASHVVFAEIDWTPSVNRQCEDRCHRIGQDDTVHVQYLVVDESLEARIARKNVQKQKNIDAAMNEDFKGDFYEADDVEVEIMPSGADEDLSGSVASSTREEITETTDEQKEAILEGVQTLSAMCDGAQSLDGMGFNKMDASFGHSLAESHKLTDKQAHYGQKLVRRYQGQLGDDLVETALAQKAA